ncbi:MAG: DHH family phosphoesterase [Nanoarchaeota archaeon]|nr:DHH family phosphoesterase [Nanoarchaeota archaeon]
MDKYEQFKEYVKECAKKFEEFDATKVIRLVSHLDADGISAASIIIKALNKKNRKYSISIIPQLDKKALEELSNEKYEYYIFTDLGSGIIKDICATLSGRRILILDHHEIQEGYNQCSQSEQDLIVHVNPHLFGIDGSKEISGAGVVYLFSKEISDVKEMAHIAVVGAIGDIQDDNGFLRLNSEILKEAVANGKMKVNVGPRFFGAQTRPLHKVLEYCSDPLIPGVSGSESGAIQFLNQIKIDPKKGAGWRKLVHLNKEEMQRLITGIIMKRLGEKRPDDVLGHIYTLIEEERESPTRDAREFSTLLNACGRLNRASLGIGVCLGDKKMKKRAIASLADYKKEIVKALDWYHQNKNKPGILIGDNFIIIHAKDQVMSTMIGTLASIISKSGDLKDGTYILSLAQAADGTTKVSLRLAGKAKETEIDLRTVIQDIVKITGGEAGGHMNAAGAIIPTLIEEEFISTAKKVFESKNQEILAN